MFEVRVCAHVHKRGNGACRELGTARCGAGLGPWTDGPGLVNTLTMRTPHPLHLP